MSGNRFLQFFLVSLAALGLVWFGYFMGVRETAAESSPLSASCTTDANGTIICTFRKPHSGTVVIYPAGVKP